MVIVERLENVVIRGKVRTQALFKCLKCGSTKTGRADMKQSTDFCRSCNKKTHGLEGTKIYNMWLNIKARCYNPKNNRYSSYGGRGIRVCDEWHDSSKFIDWALANGFNAKEGVRNTTHTIERVDVEKDYCPENCKFLPLEEQHYNKQRLSTTNTSGYIGVSVRTGRSTATITFKGKQVFNKSTKTSKHAALLRELYIIENALPSMRNFTEFSYEDITRQLQEFVSL